jgi:8-oxo-dGTP diphosphatase
MAHIHELFDFTVSGYIVRNQKILLLHHKKLGSWLQPGGHIELDEDPEQALYREIEEETGLEKSDLAIVELHERLASKDLKVLPVPFQLNVHNYGDTPHRHIDIAYLIVAKTAEIKYQQSEAHNIGWFDLADLEELLKQNKIQKSTYETAKHVLDVSVK